MGKFNSQIEPFNISAAQHATENEAGGLAFESSPEAELYSRVASCLVKEPKFYNPDLDTELLNKETERIFDLIKIVHSKNPQFIPKLAVYARNELNLRSIPILLLGAAAQLQTPELRSYVPAIIKRADELSEIISYFVLQNDNIGDLSPNTMIPNPIRRGLQDIYNSGRFNEYHFSKYNRSNDYVTMQDVIRLVHPKPVTQDQYELFRKIAKDQLGPADTWEHFISEYGSTTENWQLAARKMPIMATLRNLRNLLDNNASHETFDYVIMKLTNEEEIRKSKQFPFRFYSAYREIEGNSNSYQASRLLTALNKAMELSIKNLPSFFGQTVILVDNSGSMDYQNSGRSKIKCKDIASLFAAIISKRASDPAVVVFADDFKRVNFAEQDTIFHRKEKILSVPVGGSTYAYKPFRYLNDMAIYCDRIILLSDLQCYGATSPHENIFEEWQRYKRSNPNTYLYSFDLKGYGTVQVPENDKRALTIAGWSEKILKFIPQFEQDKSTVVKSIDAIRPERYWK